MATLQEQYEGLGFEMNEQVIACLKVLDDSQISQYSQKYLIANAKVVNYLNHLLAHALNKGSKKDTDKVMEFNRAVDNRTKRPEKSQLEVAVL